VAARYQHLSPDLLSDAVNLLDNAFSELPEEQDVRESSGAIGTAALPAETLEPDIANSLMLIGVPDGIRTRVTAVKGRCPRPLDDGDAKY
jgi:hypothetical protein